MELCLHLRKPILGTVALLILAACGVAHASTATLLLEEPYGKLGFFTATGHAAVYLSGVCSDTPLVLRLCEPGETGVVISRYNGVGEYDWVAIPLIPYLYAVERPEDVPLFADAKMVAFLRDRYRRTYLEEIAPERANGGTPGGNWYELIGTSYDRTVYGFEVATTLRQDEALIRKLNSSPNRPHFRTVSKNCADFAKDIINFYYPKSLHRSVIADVGITTPKQIAKTMIRFGARHRETEFSRLVIAQVPGSMPRSAPVHGVVDAFFTSKKYIVPSAVVSPIFAGCVAAVYVGTGAARFEPARNAMVFVVGGPPEPPIAREDQRAYRQELKHLLAGAYPEKSEPKVDRYWERLQGKAQHGVDEEGRPVLQMQLGEDTVRIGASADNVLVGSAPPQLVRQLLEARLQSELRGKSPLGLTESEVARDWKLLQLALQTNDRTSNLSSHSAVQRNDALRGNRP